MDSYIPIAACSLFSSYVERCQFLVLLCVSARYVISVCAFSAPPRNFLSVVLISTSAIKVSNFGSSTTKLQASTSVVAQLERILGKESLRLSEAVIEQNSNGSRRHM